jgi:uncharacterized protein YjiS (DUF1127 family)
MNARVAKEEIALLMPTTLSHYADEPRMDATPAAPGLFARLGRIIAWVADMPRRRAVIAELSALNDHELADIGLMRSELNRVFDPNFTARRSDTRTISGRTVNA